MGGLVQKLSTVLGKNWRLVEKFLYRAEDFWRFGAVPVWIHLRMRPASALEGGPGRKFLPNRQIVQILPAILS
jgi:hypothetical protein